MTTKIQIKKQFLNYLNSLKFSDLYFHQIGTFLDFCEYEEIEYNNIIFQNLTDYLLILNDKKLSAGTINNKIKAMRKFYEFLFKNELVSEKTLEIVRKLDYQKVSEKEYDIITEADLDKVVKKGMTYLGNIILPRKLKAMLYLVFYSGIRRSELANLKREDINLEKLTAKIKLPTKSKKERIVGFNVETGDILRKYFKQEKEIKTAFNINKSNLQILMSWLKVYLPKKNLTWHSLRRGFACMLSEKEVGIATVQKLMGHRSISTTEMYFKKSDVSALKEYNKKINRNRKPKKELETTNINKNELIDLEEEEKLKEIGEIKNEKTK